MKKIKINELANIRTISMGLNVIVRYFIKITPSFNLKMSLLLISTFALPPFTIISKCFQKSQRKKFGLNIIVIQIHA